jgi:hypothetical protein
MRQRNLYSAFLWTGILLLGVATAYPQDAASRGKEVLKKMSDKLAAAQGFSFTTVEVRQQISPSGKMQVINLSRDITVRHPNAFRVLYKGDKDWSIWYDGKFLTAVSNQHKAYIQTSMPDTLDEMLDAVAERWDLHMPISDLLYSSPYDAYIGPETKGGLVGKEMVNKESCDHLSFEDVGANYQLWLSEKTSLPCRLTITYKPDAEDAEAEARGEVYDITFKNWNVAPKITDQDFAFHIPKGYSRLPIMEKVILEESTQTGSAQTQNQ